MTRILAIVLALVIAVALLAMWRGSGSAGSSATGAGEPIAPATSKNARQQVTGETEVPPVSLVSDDGPEREATPETRASATPAAERGKRPAEETTEPVEEEPTPRYLVRGALSTRVPFDGALASISFGRNDGMGTGSTAAAFADGTFELEVTALVSKTTEGPVRGHEFFVAADHPDFLPARKSVWSRSTFLADSWTGDFVAYVELRLVPPGCVLSGTAEVDAPARAALFEVDPNTGGPQRSPVDETVVGSTYRLRAAEAGPHILVLTGEELAPHTALISVPTGELELERVVLDQGLCIGGLVELPGNRGAAGCIVQCSPAELPRGWPPKWNDLVWGGEAFLPLQRDAVVDEVGAFLACGLAPGVLKLAVAGAPGGSDSRGHETLAEAGMHGVRVIPPVALVRFFVTSQHAPVSGARVTLRPHHRGTNTDADGYGEMLLGAAAWYRVSVTSPGYLPTELSMRAPPAGQEAVKPVELVPRETGDADLVVRVKSSTPPKELLVAWRDSAASVPDLRTVQGEKGVFRLTGLPPGELEFVARPADPASFALNETFTARLKAGEAKEIVLRFRAGGRLRLRGVGGSPKSTRYHFSRNGEEQHLEAVQFLPCDETGPRNAPLEFPPEGTEPSEYSILPAEPILETAPSLAPGRYRLRFITRPFGMYDVEVEAGQTSVIELPWRDQ